jgi:signal transduction histidine kinase/CheY-like chemotaxis protein
MAIHQDSIFNELRLRIKLLEQQNGLKAEQMEDKLLLWLITDTISQANETDELLFNLLERICMIRELPYSACCMISGNKVSLLNHFTPHEEKYSRILPFSLSPELIDRLKSGPCFIDGNEMMDEGFNLSPAFFFSPESIAIFPFHCLSIPYGFFVFFYDEKTEQDISGLSIVIRQIINMATEKLDKLSLLDELKSLNAAFDKKVRERTQELIDKNNQLKKEIETLKHAGIPGKIFIEPVDKSPDMDQSLLMNISHEIRTPLNGILGFAEIIRKNELESSEKDKYINIIKSCGKSILKIVDDVIDLSNIENGQVKIIKEDFQLGKFMTDIYDYFKNDELFRQKETVEIRLSMNLDGQLFINADRKRVWQILINIIGNALKYTEKGFIEIGCKIQETDQPKKGNQDLLFTVKDTGIGIDKNMQDRVFDRFVKIEHESTRLYGGTGLGLSIAHDLVKMMEGKIWFDSEVGVGSQFYFLLPNSVLALSVKDKLISSKELKAKYNWLGKRVLIVEDDEMSFVYLKEILRSSQIEILHAKNGRIAVELTEANPNIDLVLMDIKLPELDGYEATKKIKLIRPAIPVIAQTAYAMADDQQKILQAGCDDYISKPINRRKLLQTIDRLITQNSSV